MPSLGGLAAITAGDRLRSDAARVAADLAPSCCLAATVRGVQIRVICSQPSSVGAEPGARSHAGYGQVSVRLGFAYPGRPVVWIGSGTACSPDLPAAGNPWRG